MINLYLKKSEQRGSSGHSGQKNDISKKKLKTSQTFQISSLMYLQSFWLRNMHWKVAFSPHIICGT